MNVIDEISNVTACCRKGNYFETPHKYVINLGSLTHVIISHSMMLAITQFIFFTCAEKYVIATIHCEDMGEIEEG